MKTRKYHQDIGKHYNMGRKYYECKCKFYRTLNLTHKSTSNQKGFIQEFENYECDSCEGCPLKKNCFYNDNEEKYKGQNKKLVINRNWEELKNIHKYHRFETGKLTKYEVR